MLYSLLVLASIVSAAGKKVALGDLEEYTYDQFLADFKLKYSLHENAMRRDIFNNGEKKYFT
jgi:hypothetical protein